MDLLARRLWNRRNCGTGCGAQRTWRCLALAMLAVLLVALVPSPAMARRPVCRLINMVLADDKFCIDRYESVTQVQRGNKWEFHSPFESVAGKQVRAVSRPDRYPQAYISRNEAAAACERSNKRLCTEKEWKSACMGKVPTLYPYGKEHQAGRCNDQGVSPLNHFHGTKDGPPISAYGWAAMNDPKLNQLKGTLALTGSFSRCRNGWGLFDMVGNVHEWVQDPSGVFLGGYYLDTKINGEGCNYKTTAHNATYHDYSTGFRCCADPQ